MVDDQSIAVVDAVKQQSLLSPQVKAFVGLGLAHAMVDCYGGIWAMFKTLAGLDLAWAGFVASVVIFIASSMQPIFGLYADHGHRRRLLLVGVGLTCTGMLLGPVSMFAPFMHHWSGYLVMFVILLMMQFGVAMFHPPAVTLAGQTMARRRSTVVALFIACGMVGLACSHLLFSSVYLSFNRHTELLLLPAAVVVMLVWLWCRTPQRHQPGPLGLRQMLLGITSLSPRLLPLWLIQVMVSANFAGLIFLMPEFVKARGYSAWWVNGGAFFIFIAGSALMMVPVGYLADRYGRRRILTICLVRGTPAYFLLGATHDLPGYAFVTLILLAGGLLGSAGPVGISLGQHLVVDRQSLITGMLMGLAWAVSSPTRWITGSLAKREELGPDGALTWLGVTLVVSILLSLFVPASLKDSS